MMYMMLYSLMPWALARLLHQCKYEGCSVRNRVVTPYSKYELSIVISSHKDRSNELIPECPTDRLSPKKIATRKKKGGKRTEGKDRSE